MATVKLVSFTLNPQLVIRNAAGACYSKKVSDNGLRRILESGHWSIAEHASATFEIECSIAVLGQITRHRHLSFSVRSTRACSPDGHATPKTLEYGNREYYRNCMEQIATMYNAMLDRGEPYENASYLIPRGAMTKIVVTGNFRAWADFLKLRLCERTMHEHREVANSIYAVLHDIAPDVFNENTVFPCETCKEETGCKHYEKLGVKRDTVRSGNELSNAPF